jgi:hypothetical protein
MFMPNLLRNFLYARHSSGCWWLDNLLKFVASELHCCANFSRKFFWSSERHRGRGAGGGGMCLCVCVGGGGVTPAGESGRWHQILQQVLLGSLEHPTEYCLGLNLVDK